LEEARERVTSEPTLQRVNIVQYRSWVSQHNLSLQPYHFQGCTLGIQVFSIQLWSHLLGGRLRYVRDSSHSDTGRTAELPRDPSFHRNWQIWTQALGGCRSSFLFATAKNEVLSRTRLFSPSVDLKDFIRFLVRNGKSLPTPGPTSGF